MKVTCKEVILYLFLECKATKIYQNKWMGKNEDVWCAEESLFKKLEWKVLYQKHSFMNEPKLFFIIWLIK